MNESYISIEIYWLCCVASQGRVHSCLIPILKSAFSRLKLACIKLSITFAWTYFIIFLLTLWGWPSHSGLQTILSCLHGSQWLHTNQHSVIESPCHSVCAIGCSFFQGLSLALRSHDQFQAVQTFQIFGIFGGKVKERSGLRFDDFCSLRVYNCRGEIFLNAFLAFAYSV